MQSQLLNLLCVICHAPPLYVNTVYKSHLQLNAEPHSYLHCACVWECTTHWHTVSDLYVKLCTGLYNTHSH